MRDRSLFLAALIVFSTGCATRTPAEPVVWNPALCARGKAIFDMGFRRLREFRGVVSFEESVGLPGVTLALTSLTSPHRTYLTTSGPDGRFEIRGVPSGLYHLDVCLPGMCSVIASIRITPWSIARRLPIRLILTT